MKKFKVSFDMFIRNSCVIQTPEEMINRDEEDGRELGYTIRNVEVLEEKFFKESWEDL